MQCSVGTYRDVDLEEANVLKYHTSACDAWPVDLRDTYGFCDTLESLRVPPPPKSFVIPLPAAGTS